MRKSKRIVSSVVVVTFLLFSVMTSFAKPTADQPNWPNWAATQISTWTDMDLIKGYPDGTFKPDNTITRAEFATLIMRVFNLQEKALIKFDDVAPGSWYEDAVLKAYEAGITNGVGNNKFMPDKDISREEAATMVARAYDLVAKNSNSYADFADRNIMSDWAKDAISALVENKFIQGTGNNKFSPLNPIKRAETVVMLNNPMGALVNTAKTYSKDAEKNLVVNTSGVTLKDMTINGNLYIAQGVGEGKVILDNVTVKGDIIAKAGGDGTATKAVGDKNGIILLNSTVNGKVIVDKKKGVIKIIATGNTSVSNLLIKSAASIEEDGLTGGNGFIGVVIPEEFKNMKIELIGNFDTVKVEGKKVNLDVKSGTIGNLAIGQNADGSTINIGAAAKVSYLKADSKIDIAGKGELISAVLNVKGTTSEIIPVNLKIAADAQVTIGGKTMTDKDNHGTIVEPTPSASSSTSPSTSAPTPTPSNSNGNNNNNNNNTTQNVTYTGASCVLKTAGTKTDVDKVIDLKTCATTDELTGIKINTNATALNITRIEYTMGSMNYEKTIEIENSSSEIAVSKILPMAGSSVSLSTLVKTFGKSLTITGTLTKSGYTTKNATLTILLPGDNTKGIPVNKYAEVTTEGQILTASIKYGQENVKPADLGIYTTLNALFGEVPKEMKIPDNDDTTVEVYLDTLTKYKDIQSALAKLGGKNSWAELTLGDLATKKIYFKADNKEYTLYVVKANDYFNLKVTEVSSTNVEIKATIKDGKDITPDTAGASGWVKALIDSLYKGYTYKVCVVKDGESTDSNYKAVTQTNYAEIANYLSSLTGKAWNVLKLSDLDGKKLYFKDGTVKSPVYEITIAK